MTGARSAQALESLLAYYEPLSTLRRDFRGTATLYTPDSPLLGANASYLLPTASQGVLPLLKAWHEAQGAPPLIASLGELPGQGPEQVLRVGMYVPILEPNYSAPGLIVVEQISRLHLPRFAAVLAESYGLAEWAQPLARGLAASLESLPDAALLLAYAGGEEIGALLWQAGAAHLWGSLDRAADAPLMDAAAELSRPAGGVLWTSLPDSSPLVVPGESEVCFTLLG